MSGKINKNCNLYDKNGALLRHIDEKTGRLRNYTIEELEQYCDTLDPNTDDYRNCVNMLVQWYQNPPTKQDREYVQKKQAELIQQLQKRAEENDKSSVETVEEALKEVESEVEDEIH